MFIIYFNYIYHNFPPLFHYIYYLFPNRVNLNLIIEFYFNSIYILIVFVCTLIFLRYIYISIYFIIYSSYIYHIIFQAIQIHNR